ncbi:MAG TPA: hypothetical protein DCF33_13695 [Saprospirales bacterium]|nr:hypothetical protein [Saprospirales bacterium]
MRPYLSIIFTLSAGALLALYLGLPVVRDRWESFLVAFAAVVLAPMALKILQVGVPGWYVLIAALFAISLPLSGPWWLAVPYLTFAAWNVWTALVQLLSVVERPLVGWVRLFALGYWFTGGIWALFHLLEYSPLDFDPVIVILTSAHFHLAGFVASTMVFSVVSKEKNRLIRVLGICSLIGMPFVALGITLTRLGFDPVWEQCSALFFLGYAGLLIYQLSSWALQKDCLLLRRTLLLGATGSLGVGIFLAFLYALRFQIPIDWITIPNMKYWHGTLNTLGFGWMGLYACLYNQLEA